MSAHTLAFETGTGIDIIDITGQVRNFVQASGVADGLLTITSQHTTTAVTINEYEPRLLDDMRAFLEKLAPPDTVYRHNDIALRDCPPDEPENAHSHLMAMLMGTSESIPIIDGQLVLGQYQSIMLLELDGPRHRTVSLQLLRA